MPRYCLSCYSFHMIKVPNILQLALLTILLGSAQVFGADPEPPVFVKVFAGVSPASWGDFRREVRRNLKRKATIPERTEIACEVGRWYALGVIATQPGVQMMFFETTAIFRDLDNYDVPRHSHREHTLKKEQFGTRRFAFKIREGAVDHDATVVVHVGKQVYVRHTFEIRGCSVPR